MSDAVAPTADEREGRANCLSENRLSSRAGESWEAPMLRTTSP